MDPSLAKEGQVAFLLIDVDGYGPAGVDGRVIVSAAKNGYRPRELGWAYYYAKPGKERFLHETGSVYFVDDGLPPLRDRDPCVRYIRSALQGLPVHPCREDYEGAPVFRANELHDVLALLDRFVRRVTGARRVVFLHKGGPEGLWVEEAMPGAVAIELGTLGCPKVDQLGREHPSWTATGACTLHDSATLRARSRRKKGVVHCPRLEVKLMALWLGRGEVSVPGEPSETGGETGERLVPGLRSCTSSGPRARDGDIFTPLY